jgi:hypothetical protein
VPRDGGFPSFLRGETQPPPCRAARALFTRIGDAVGGIPTQDMIKARGVCAGCRFRTDCLDWAIDNGERWGVWGGHTMRERDWMATHGRR